MTKVITYGTFDLFHQGHYRLLERAKALGDYLIVGVTTESFDKARGKLNVIDPLMTRIENVRKTGFADKIIIEESPGQKFSDIKKYGIDIFTVGSDWRGKFDYLKDYCKVVYLERTKDVSSTMLREQKRHIQRIGVIGTGRITNRFMPEATRVSGVNPQGVYNPHPESAARFAEKWSVRVYDTQEALFDDVDLVYIAAPHQYHYAYAKNALEHGKHVLCEKPMALKKAQAEELYALARKQGVILMEGIKTCYCPCFHKLLGIVMSGRIGQVRNIEACFTKLENPASRELTDRRFGGSLRELGSYVLMPILKIFGLDYEDVRFESIDDENGIDQFTKVSFRYKNGFATATCGLGVKADGRLLISGTTGYIVVPAPWWLMSYFEIHREDPNDIERYSEPFLGPGLRYEISEFLHRLDKNADTQEQSLMEKESIALAELMETFGRVHPPKTAGEEQK